jgi:hypothetical protein
LNNTIGTLSGDAKLASANNFDTFLRSLICQLCPNDDVPLELRSLYHERSPAQPSGRELRSTLLSLLRTFGGDPDPVYALGSSQEPKEIFLVFDGLDELSYGTTREMVVHLIQEIDSLVTADHLHILVTSRPERDISSHFPSQKGWIRHKMQVDKILVDIKSYTVRQIANHRGLSALPDRVKEEIIETLVEGSRAMLV